jgi:hypothetical protein
MGCDFYWNATEEDIFRQRKVGWFLESLFDADDKGISSYFNTPWNCRTFNGYYTGYFLDLYNLNKVTELTTLQLIGTTIYCGDLSDMDGWNGDAGQPYSFVFDNTNYNPPELITFEIISDLSKPKYDWIREHFCDVENGESNYPKAIFKRGGYDRLIANEGWLATLFYSIKKQFLPKLDVSDDYLYFENIMELEPSILPEFSESICKASLAAKWDLGRYILIK